MSIYKIILFTLLFISYCNMSSAEDPQDIQPRHLSKHKCRLGGCGGNFGYGGYQGFSGYQGYPYPPINIGISQSQASSSGYDGYPYQNSFPYYNQNNQYNGFPNYGSFGYSSNPYNPYGPFNPGYGYNRPFPGPYPGPYNNQFNGNYYLGNTGAGYGLVKRFSEYEDENYGEDRSAGKKTE